MICVLDACLSLCNFLSSRQCSIDLAQVTALVERRELAEWVAFDLPQQQVFISGEYLFEDEEQTMHKQPAIPNPLNLFVFGWAITATFTCMFMFGMYPMWVSVTRRPMPESKDKFPSMTAEEEELLLHLVD